MVESASCASASPGAAASRIEEEGRGVPGAAGPEAPMAVEPALALAATVGASGARVIPPCSKDQVTTAQAPACNKKAAETLWRSHESGCRVRWKVNAIDYTWFGLGLGEPYWSQDPRVNVC